MTAPDTAAGPAPSLRMPRPSPHTPRPIAAAILGTLSGLHGVFALVLGLGGKTSAIEFEGFILGLTASVLMTGAILSYGLVRLLRELRVAVPRPH